MVYQYINLPEYFEGFRGQQLDLLRIPDIAANRQYAVSSFALDFLGSFFQYIQFSARDDHIGSQFRKIDGHSLAQSRSPTGYYHCFTSQGILLSSSLYCHIYDFLVRLSIIAFKIALVDGAHQRSRTCSIAAPLVSCTRSNRRLRIFNFEAFQALGSNCKYCFAFLAAVVWIRSKLTTSSTKPTFNASCGVNSFPSNKNRAALPEPIQKAYSSKILLGTMIPTGTSFNPMIYSPAAITR